MRNRQRFEIDPGPLGAFVCGCLALLEQIEIRANFSFANHFVQSICHAITNLRSVQVLLLGTPVFRHWVSVQLASESPPRNHNNQDHQQQRYNPSRQQKGIAERRELNDRLMLGGAW